MIKIIMITNDILELMIIKLQINNKKKKKIPELSFDIISIIATLCQLDVLGKLVCTCKTYNTIFQKLLYERSQCDSIKITLWKTLEIHEGKVYTDEERSNEQVNIQSILYKAALEWSDRSGHGTLCNCKTNSHPRKDAYEWYKMYKKLKEKGIENGVEKIEDSD